MVAPLGGWILTEISLKSYYSNRFFKKCLADPFYILRGHKLEFQTNLTLLFTVANSADPGVASNQDLHRLSKYIFNKKVI